MLLRALAFAAALFVCLSAAPAAATFKVTGRVAWREPWNNSPKDRPLIGALVRVMDATAGRDVARGNVRTDALGNFVVTCDDGVGPFSLRVVLDGAQVRLHDPRGLPLFIRTEARAPV